MKLVLIADTFPPLRSSGAAQLYDLSSEITSLGHDLTVIIPINDLEISYRVEKACGFEIVYVRVPKFKDVGMFKRGLAEFCLSFFVIWSLRGTRYLAIKFDGVIWYSPTIFLSFFVHYLKFKCKCPAYLILRDIFPEWLVDMKLIGTGFIYRVLKLAEYYQYSLATTIGVQAFGNLQYFSRKNTTRSVIFHIKKSQKIEVLHNWLGSICSKNFDIKIRETKLRGRKIFIYTGNMGVAQNVNIFLNLAEKMQENNKVGFVFIGRGSEFGNLKKLAITRSLSNTIFFDEVPREELGSLYRESSVALLSLDVRHRLHNIPGKFLSYMRVGLPVLAVVNPDNDLIDIVKVSRVGKATASNSLEEIHSLALDLLNEIDQGKDDISTRCTTLMDEMFSPSRAVRQILDSFTKY